jgi:hypothetical protein
VKKIVIIKSIGLGFFSLFNHLLGTIDLLENNKTQSYYNYTPYAFFRDTVYSDGIVNLWDIFFEPISEFNLEQIFGTNDYNIAEKLIDNNISSIINNNKIHVAEYHNCPQGLGYTSNDVESMKKVDRFRNIVKKYIKLKNNTSDKINLFYDKYMSNKKVIGIHFRATDKPEELLAYLSNTGRQVRLLSIDDFINEANKHNPEVIFLSTDCNKSKQRALDLSDKVIFTDCFRSDTNYPVHYGSSPDRCEEVIIDCYLLSKCNHIIHALSNVPQSALYLNEKLTNTFLI